jgi:hypothetical protein
MKSLNVMVHLKQTSPLQINNFLHSKNNNIINNHNNNKKQQKTTTTTTTISIVAN